MTTSGSNADAGSASVAEPRPIAPAQRIESVDVLRGVAIFGILLANMYYYAYPFYMRYAQYLEWIEEDPTGHLIDRLAYNVSVTFFSDPLYTLFSLLFGFGMAMMMTRSDDPSKEFASLFLRRMVALLLIGVGHVVLLWHGDILITYAINGTLLLLFRRRAQRTLLMWGCVLVVAGACIRLAPEVLLFAATRAHPPSATQPSPVRRTTKPVVPATASAPATSSAPTTTSAPTTQPDLVEAFDTWLRTSVETYEQGSFPRTMRQRIVDYIIWTLLLLWHQYPTVLGMMVLGVYAHRQEIFRDPQRHLGLLRGLALLGLVVGIGGCAWHVYARVSCPLGPMKPVDLAGAVGFAVGGPFLCLGIASSFVLLLRAASWQRWSAPIAYVGRMSLSSYLLQSLICSLIFNGYGLGYYATLGPAAGLVLAVAIYAAQVPMSVWWLRTFRFGPIEWLWRTLTYGRSLPVRVQRPRDT